MTVPARRATLVRRSSALALLLVGTALVLLTTTMLLLPVSVAPFALVKSRWQPSDA